MIDARDTLLMEVYPTMPIDGYLTAEEAAERLSLTVSAIYKAIDAGKLKAQHISPQRVLIREADLAAYAEGREKRGWVRRREPGYQPSAAAQYARDYRARKKAEAAQQAQERQHEANDNSEKEEP